MIKKCLIFYEENQGTFAKDLLEVARQMYGENFESYALVVNTLNVNDIIGFDYVLAATEQLIADDDQVNMTNLIETCYQAYKFDAVLFLATHLGRMLAPRLAMRLHVGLVADVTAIKRHDDGVIEMIRPAFEGKMLAGITNTGGRPILMSIRPGIFIPESRTIKIPTFLACPSTTIEKVALKRVNRINKPDIRDIRESRILVAGGGGVLKDFAALDELAQALGGLTAASRRIVDNNKADRAIQVGQSGKIVHPDLYIALGIYGALQHVAGLNRVKHLIAVNTNVNAPICSLADMVVVGDAAEFVRKLIQRIKDEPEARDKI